MDTNTLHKPPIHFKDMSWFNRCIVFCGLVLDLVLLLKHLVLLALLSPLLFVPIWLSLGFTLSLIAILIMSVVGIYICGQTAKILDVHDDGRIVWDEFAGQSITFLPLLYLQQINWIWVITGFILFRIFDVWKPWPIRVIDRQVHGGFGIMLDDIIAGVWAALCTLIIIHLS